MGRARFHRVVAVAIAASLALAVIGSGSAQASRGATRAEAKAIKKAFLKSRSKSPTKINRIRVSTVDSRFAAVSFTANHPEPKAITSTAYKPAPVILKKGKGGKWKPSSKAPTKVKKDLKVNPKSSIRLTGEVTATLTQPASCSPSGNVRIYDRTRDISVSIEFIDYAGPGIYEALGVNSLAALAIGNKATVPQFETGQGNNAYASSGVIIPDDRGYGIIEAGMARIPLGDTTHPITIIISGMWECRR
jgi:hypothetical protein